MAESDRQMETIARQRKLRAMSNNGSVLTIPPIMRELTHFDIGDDVEIEARVGGNEIVLRRKASSSDEDTTQN